MRAVVYDAFGGPLEVREVPSPQAPVHGVVLRVLASGLCRSDWHGWQGHDPDIRVPHVPGHEMVGIVDSVGSEVSGWTVGQRVTAPFVCACGTCPPCLAGDHQVCDHQTQPGFTHWGSFADLVAVHHADVNLVELPADIDSVPAAILGCRFATAWRAVVLQGRVEPGQWVAVHGCGGVGLSAVMIAVDAAAQVVAVDLEPDALEAARTFGAVQTVRAGPDAADEVRGLTDGGAHVSIDAIGLASAAEASVRCLRTRGRHVQVGLLPPTQAQPVLPMDLVIGQELEILGCHGLAAHEYPRMLGRIVDGRMPIERLVTRRIGLDDVPSSLMAMGSSGVAGVTVVEP